MRTAASKQGRQGLGRLLSVILSITIVAGLSVLSPGVASAQPTKDILVLESYRFETMDLTKFMSTNRAGYPWFDWSTDGCSIASVPGFTSYSNSVFYKACVRHDFGYRNEGLKGRLKLNPIPSQRLAIDNQLRTDMNGLCQGTVNARDLLGLNGSLARTRAENKVNGCVQTATIYYTAVRKFGAAAFGELR